MSFHRLTTPTYLGGMPGTHDYINNTPGDPSQAPADAAKSGGPNAGTLFVAFGEDGTSSNTNRANKALAQNLDFIDDVVSAELPVPAELTVTAPGGVVTTYQLLDDVFVGISGVYLDTTEWKDKLVRVVDPATGNEILGSGNLPVRAAFIKDSTNSSNVVGTIASGFYTNPYLTLTPGVPTGQDFKVIYGKRSSLTKIIKDKTNLDALTRIAVPGSPQVVGETIRFMREAARRSGSVQALATTILETPGIGDNVRSKTANMIVDLDPDGTFAANNHQLLVRGHRDGTSKSYLTVTPDAASPTTVNLRSPSYGLSLGDAATTAALGDVPLSDATNDRYRSLDKNTTGTNPSLLAALNRRWTVTVGDGTNSFGDFSSIAAAITFFQSNYINVTGYGHGMTILLKPGSYTVSDIDIDFLVGSDNYTGVTIRGASKESCIVTVNGSTAGFIVESDGALTLENITFVKGSQNATVKLGNSGKLRLQDCLFLNQKLLIDKTADRVTLANARMTRDTLVAERCVWQVASAISSPVLDFSLGGSVDTSGYLFTDCYLNNTVDYPICRLSDKAGTTGAYLRKVIFTRCEMWPGGSTATTSVAPAGGVFDIVAQTVNGLTVTDITWKDCKVEGATTVSGPTSSTLLYLITRGTTGSYGILFKHVKILGGSWIANGSCVILPFYIGGQHGVASYNCPVKLQVEDVTFGWGGTTSWNYGALTTELDLTGTTVENAAFMLNATFLRVRNASVAGLTVRGGSGDLLLASSGLDVDGVFVGVDGAYYNTADYGQPYHRVRIRGSGVVRNLQVRGTAAAQACNSAVWLTGVSSRLVLRDSSVSQFTVNSHGIELDWVAIPDPGLHLVNCHIHHNGGAGFYLYDDATVNHGSPMQELRILGCDIHNNTGDGILINTKTGTYPKAIYEVMISNNMVTANGGIGIVFAPAVLPSHRSLNINGNTCVANDAYNTLQILLGLDDNCAYGRTFQGCVMGNNCGASDDTLANRGMIGFTYNFGGSATPIMETLATEMDYNGTGPIMDVYWNDEHACIHNFARLKYWAV